MKIKIDKADQVFSQYIRFRDKFTCKRCWKYYPEGKGLSACHFWSRWHEGTRFESDNVISMCFGCHQRMDADKHGEFRDFMLKRLGEKRFKTLEVQARTYCRKDRAMAYLVSKALLNSLSSPHERTYEKET